MKNCKIIFFLLATIFAKSTFSQSYKVVSPDKKIFSTIYLNSNKQLCYKISYNNKEVMAPSGLGFVMLEGSELKNNLKVIAQKSSYKDESYTFNTGKNSNVRNNYNEIIIQTSEISGLKRQMNVIFRAYNDGIAFRYFFPEQAIKNFNIISELSEFNFSEDAPSWAQHLPHFNWNYEKGFDKVNLSGIYGTSALSDPIMQYLYCFDFPAAFNKNKLIGLPLVTEMKNGPAVAIAEADLKNYGGMYLQNTPGKPQVHTVISPLPEGNGVRVKLKTPYETPWRAIMIAESAGKLIESNLLLNLNRPANGTDWLWVKPGKSTWDFLSDRAVSDVDFKGGMNMETLKYYVDFASEYKMEYYTIDGGWCPGVTWFKDNPEVDQLKAADGIDIPALAKYAANKNVGLFLWVRYDNIKSDMEKIFSTFEKWGIKGVKIDFMDSDDQDMVNWYEKCLASAAKYHLLVNFHGAYKATGLNRTYPNYITQEGVKGLEWANTTTTLDATHNVTLAYTRLLVGPMDYTPGGFNNVRPDKFEYMKFAVTTTRAQQLAMTVVYESPLLTLSDAPHIYRANAESEFFKTLPTAWDETRFISGTTGEYIVLARRKGTDWFVGGLNNEIARSVKINLSFLNKTIKYRSTIYEDASDADTNPKKINKREITLNGEDILQLNMAKSGGFVIRLQAN